MEDLVSIITPVYNSERFLGECLDSVISQSYKNWEHILVDDCSTDKSAQIIKNYAKEDKRIKYVKLTENSGAGISRNTAILASKGKYIAFLDSDDYWHSEKLDKQINFMISNDFSFTYTDYFIINREENEPSYRIKGPIKVNYGKMLKNDYIGCLTAIYNAEVLGKQYMPNIRKRQDWVLWLRILKKVKFAYGLDEPLAFYRVGNSSLSNYKFKLLKHNFNVYYQELNMSYFKSLLMMINFLFHYFWFKIFSKRKVVN